MSWIRHFLPLRKVSPPASSGTTATASPPGAGLKPAAVFRPPRLEHIPAARPALGRRPPLTHRTK